MCAIHVKNLNKTLIEFYCKIMKKFIKNLSLFAVVASLGFMMSCNEDEETFDVPIVSFESSVLDASGNAELEPGDVLSFIIDVDAPGGFNTLNGTFFKDGVEFADTVISKTPGSSPLDYRSDQFNFEIENEDVGSTFAMEFQAVDEAGQLSNKLILTVEVTSPEARSYSAVLLAAPLGNKEAQSFYSVASGVKYSPSEVTGTQASISPTIDFGYYYGSNNKASIASPAGFLNTVFAGQVEGWNTKNETVIKATTIGSSEFNEVTTWAGIDVEFEAGTDEEGIITQLVAGDVVAFETVGGVRGLILINEIIDGDDPKDGKFDGELDGVSIEILAQLEVQ